MQPSDHRSLSARQCDPIEAAKIPSLDAIPEAKPDKALGLLHDKFEELSAPMHPLRAALQKLHTLGPIRIIEGKRG